MSDPVPIDPERLLAQTAWVRRLARSLARDEASADDLVQESYAAALRRPPQGEAHDARLRAWFGRVLRNLAFRRRREELRREEREQRSRRDRGPESDERAQELEELRAELFGHVKALPAASREVVLLRYFEELDSAQIARRLGIPDSTVRNRLRRALAELRERMQHTHGKDWRDLCLFVLPSSSAKVAAGSSAVVAAASGVWIASGAIAVVALTLLAALWMTRGTSADLESQRSALAAVPVEIPPSVQATDPRSAGAGVPGSRFDPDSTRTPEAGALHVVVSDRYEPPPTTPFEHGIIVYGVVRDEAGEPLDVVGLQWTDAWGQRRFAASRNGKYSANSLTPGTQVLRIGGRLCMEELREIVLAPDREMQEFDLVVRRADLVPVYAFDRSPSGARSSPRAQSDAWIDGFNAVRTHAPPSAQMSSGDGFEDFHPGWNAMIEGTEFGQTRPHGAMGMLQVPWGEPCWVALLRNGKVLQTQHMATTPERIEFEIDPLTSREDPSPLRRFLTTNSIREALIKRDGPGRESPERTRATLRLHFLDEAGRGVMANFLVTPAEGAAVSDEPYTGCADSKGVREWFFAPGRYLLRVTGTRDDNDPTFVHVSALPRYIEVGPGPEPTDLLVPLITARKLLLRSRCGPEDVFDWTIETAEGLPMTQGLLVGHAPKSLELPPGMFRLRIRARGDATVLAYQEFEVRDEALTLELER